MMFTLELTKENKAAIELFILIKVIKKINVICIFKR